MNDTAPAARHPLPLWRFVLWSVIAGILLTPAVAMNYTVEVDWTATDFIFAGAVLGFAGALFEIVMLTIRTPLHRLIAGLFILGGVVLVWGAAVRGLI